MMNVVALSAPHLITRPEELKELANILADQPVVAVDTESNSLYAYREQVCLLQFSIPEADFLVDPLALKDLTLLAPLFHTAEIEKVFHAAEYDLICLKRDFDFDFANLFDTMVASRILGRDALGLGAILENEFGVRLDKRFQRANWGQRPLPADLLAYARLDTHYLIPLRERLHDDLRKRDLLPLAAEDFGRMCHVNGRAVEDKSLGCWRVSGSYDLTPQQAAVLVELCQYRDKIARMLNRPLFKVLNDRTLLGIAAQLPQNLKQLSLLPGMTKGQVERHGRALLAAVQRGLQADPVYPPRSPRPNEQFLDRVDALRRWRKSTAQDLGVMSDVVMPRDLLYSIAEHNPQNMEELGVVMHEAPWRLEHFGGQILDLLQRA